MCARQGAPAVSECACAHPFTRVVCACRAREDDTCVICQVQGQSREVMAPTALPRAMESALRGAKNDAGGATGRNPKSLQPRAAVLSGVCAGIYTIKGRPHTFRKAMGRGCPEDSRKQQEAGVKQPLPPPGSRSSSSFSFFSFSSL